MKKVFLQFFILFFLPLSVDAKQIMHSLRLQFPQTLHTAPSLIALYKGCEYISSNKAFELYEDSSCRELYILITQDHIKRPRTCDVRHLETLPGHPYKLFKLTRASKIQEVTKPDFSALATMPSAVSREVVEYWEIEEQPYTQEVLRIPDNTLIILTNPDFIKTFISDTWRMHDSFIHLPTCIFEDTLDEKALHEVSAKMIFASLDLRCLHKKTTKTIKSCAHNRIISVPNPIHSYTI